MKRLLVLIRSQHQAWNDRLAARARLLRCRAAEEGGDREGPVQDGGRGEGGDGETGRCPSGQSEALSVYTMSSR